MLTEAETQILKTSKQLFDSGNYSSCLAALDKIEKDRQTPAHQELIASSTEKLDTIALKTAMVHFERGEYEEFLNQISAIDSERRDIELHNLVDQAQQKASEQKRSRVLSEASTAYQNLDFSKAIRIIENSGFQNTDDSINVLYQESLRAKRELANKAFREVMFGQSSKEILELIEENPTLYGELVAKKSYSTNIPTRNLEIGGVKFDLMNFNLHEDKLYKVTLYAGQLSESESTKITKILIRIVGKRHLEVDSSYTEQFLDDTDVFQWDGDRFQEQIRVQGILKEKKTVWFTITDKDLRSKAYEAQQEEERASQRAKWREEQKAVEAF
ncbi:hypothetical protein [Pelagicoccus mobilis]|uniref:hypothetical protein n=1 Tax=Pelagicoccus mobilis TaxID=415221 RepID=UPI0035EB3CD4